MHTYLPFFLAWLEEFTQLHLGKFGITIEEKGAILARARNVAQGPDGDKTFKQKDMDTIFGANTAAKDNFTQFAERKRQEPGENTMAIKRRVIIKE